MEPVNSVLVPDTVKEVPAGMYQYGYAVLVTNPIPPGNQIGFAVAAPLVIVKAQAAALFEFNNDIWVKIAPLAFVAALNITAPLVEDDADTHVNLL